MKLLLLGIFVIIWQVSESEEVKRSGESLDDVINRAKRDANFDWRDRLRDAIGRTKFRERREKEEAKKGKGNHANEKLAKFLSSNKRITDSGKSAKTQLYIMKQLLAEWKRKQQELGKPFKIEEFWEYIKQRGKILKANKSSKTSDSPGTARKDEDIDVCPFQHVACPESVRKYRTFDGTCNNLGYGKTQWGGNDRAQERLLPPDYSDGVEDPRVASDGSPLPSARKVSNSLFDVKSDPSGINTVLLMSMGQFLDHDITHTPGATVFNEETGKNEPVFCGDDNCGIPGDAGKDCFGIPPDPSKPDKDCMYFVRSEAFLKDDCSLSQRQIANTITAWVDASHVYGSGKEECNSLRDDDSKRGRMKMSAHPIDSSMKPLLPYADNEESGCSGLNDIVRCFRAGDVRQNEQVGLTSLHTILVRLHNYIEEKLHDENDHWDGETLFQETRKLVIAIWQHIVYNEYLPVILGPRLMHEYKLNPTRYGYSYGYDPRIRGDILAVFSTAAFRFGHTQITNNMTYADYHFHPEEDVPFSEILFNPSTLFNCPLKGMAGIDAVVNGMICAHAEKFDRHFSEQIKHHLFTDNPPHGHGFDLAALNIQRGRDHGIKGYTAWRVKLGLDRDSKYWDFSDLRDIDRDALYEFKKLYKTPKDIDLFAAGVSEKPVPGGVVGKTFAHIIALQFLKLKKGDRFFYEHKHQYGFTGKQLAEIKKFTMAKVLCYTLDKVDKIQPYVFLQAKDKLPKGYDWTRYNRFMHNNYRRPCSSLSEIDFSVFGENSSHGSKGHGHRSHSHSSKSKSSKSTKPRSSSSKSKHSSGSSKHGKSISSERKH